MIDPLWPTIGVGLLTAISYLVVQELRRQQIEAKQAEAQLQTQFDQLADRVASIERLEPPRPLERVSTFSLWLVEPFWADALKATADEIAHVKGVHQGMPSCVWIDIQHWISHTIILPMGGFRDRTPIPIYPPDFSFWDHQTIWAIQLQEDSLGAQLELRLQEGELRLCAVGGRFGTHGRCDTVSPQYENIFLRIPLDAARLNKFRRPDDPSEVAESVLPAQVYKSTPWKTEYRHVDKMRGMEWRLVLLDLVAYGKSGRVVTPPVDNEGVMEA